ncbi:MAG: hypothetical protein QOJ03_816 [Frankiaceae bacterium]|nr:hypothetical protein [Frankiaceae bacterium]
MTPDEPRLVLFSVARLDATNCSAGPWFGGFEQTKLLMDPVGIRREA